MGVALALVAAVTYGLTIEPTASLWDCPEFIACGYKLEIGHPPGAPFFMLMANLFSQFASTPSQVAWWVNLLSALLSAGCILFLFWTITHLARRLIIDDGRLTPWRVVLVEACGVVGALVYTWSDTFWFSAVEAEVYAFSSFLTALVFWLILRWEDDADQPQSDRWLVLIAYVIGLSIGVHLLNLLCIPPMVLVVYYRRSRQVSTWRTLGALAVGAALVALVLYGIIPGVVRVGGWMELLCTNVLGLPYNTGLLLYVGLLALAIGVWVARARRRWMRTASLCVMALMMGYSCYAVILVRSLANPPMDENSPSNIFALGSYLGREQYGDKPLLYGPAYTSQVLRRQQGEYMVPVFSEGAPVYQPSTDSSQCRYQVVDHRRDYVYRQNMPFPRMHSARHAGAYEQWLGGVTKRDGLPTQRDNWRFFFSYQVGHMYLRYLFWNFVGRQNNIQGFGEVEHGNWITGIAPIDNLLLGCDTSRLPADLRDNPGRNVFYGLPLLLGVLGMVFQLRRGQRGNQQWNVVGLLFLMTGLAIVVYLNQTPMEPRERDYAYAGSFYAYAIWTGLGVAGLASLLRRLHLGKWSVLAAAILALMVPVQMVSQTWDDHDRSHRYMCRDFGANYLQTMPDEGHPIILTNGDNDTFPLWYNHEVEGVRTDTRVCNLSYAQTDWYIDQMRRPAYDSPSLPITWDRDAYTEGRNEVVEVNPQDSITITCQGRPMTIRMEGTDRLTKSDLLVLEMLSHAPADRPIYASISMGNQVLPWLHDHLVLEGMAYRIVPESGPMRVDVDRLYDNLMHRYRYGGLSRPGLYVDEDALRMANMHQYIFSVLIRQLMAQGDLQRARRAAEKWMRELPPTNVPYTEDALALAECLYRTHQEARADAVVENLLSRSAEWLSWLQTISPARRRGSQQTQAHWLRTLEHALYIAHNYQRNELVNRYIKAYENLLNPQTERRDTSVVFPQ